MRGESGIAGETLIHQGFAASFRLINRIPENHTFFKLIPPIAINGPVKRRERFISDIVATFGYAERHP
jgi:hypothetical protein